VVVALGELPAVVDAVVLVAGEHQSVVAFPLVGVDIRTGFLHQFLNDGQQTAPRGIGNNLGVHDAVALENTDNGDLGLRTAPPRIAAVPGAEVALVNLNVTGQFP